MRRWLQRFASVVGSNRFFYGIMAFFVLESLWVACSAVYPMAFDEDFHLGIITIYSHQWSPFLGVQPSDAAQFGAIQHDPSYLYHYLMSFPYRLIRWTTDSQTAQVIALRLINVGLFAWGLVLFRRVLRRAGTSAALSHVALALFVLIPIVPLVAGQINYDNALMPLAALTCLLVFDIYGQLRKRRLPVRSLALLAMVTMLGSLVKYPFLPLAATAVLFVVACGVRAFWGCVDQVLPALQQGYRALGKRTLWLLVFGLVLSTGLFVQRYGFNLARYHTPVPDCQVVLDEDQCMAYGPWARNHQLAAAKDEATSSNPLAYTWQWLQGLHYRLFFMINGPADKYRNYPPLPLPAAAAVIIAVSSGIALLLYGRRVFSGQPLLVFLLVLSLVYVVALWLSTYSQFVETGQPVAINGRYLLPVLLPLTVVFGRALSIALARWPRTKTVLVGLALLLFLQGGGVLSFIVRSDDAWYWPHSAVAQLNNKARRVLSPVIIKNNTYY